MNDNLNKDNKEIKDEEINVLEKGPISKFLSKECIDHESEKPDHIGVEIIKVKPNKLIEVVSKLKDDGFNYLQCQGGYDEGPGLKIVCFYHLIKIEDIEKTARPKEIRIKVFLDRAGDLKVPSLYKLFRGSDWQERETYESILLDILIQRDY